ncbi:MAG TPA: cytochrome P450 [Thermoanaerobaculia bacterium]
MTVQSLSRPAQTASRSIPSASFGESLRFALFQLLPNILQGLFKRKPSAIGLFNALGTDRRAVALISRLHKKYGDSVHLRFGGLLLMGMDGVRHVLDHSPDVYADPPTKRNGMSHFQPDAVTISRGETWKDRRRFNEAVLSTHQRAHPHAVKFLAAAQEEVGRLEGRSEIAWRDFEDVFERITLRVLFGDGARDDRATSDHLKSLMKEANRRLRGPSPQPSEHLKPFQDAIQGYIDKAEPGSLAASAAATPAGPDTRPARQFPHWMFAMRDTDAANTARALALILSHPDTERRVRKEIEGVDISTPEGIGQLRFLEACIQEAMRIWPTTPLLSREAIADDVLGGAPVPKGTQVLVSNTFLHRDGFPEADTFSPHRWLDNDGYGDRFQHFSSGPQGCAGVHLALFIAKAVIATLLRRRYELIEPPLDPSEPLPHAYNYFRVRFAGR